MYLIYPLFCINISDEVDDAIGANDEVEVEVEVEGEKEEEEDLLFKEFK